MSFLLFKAHNWLTLNIIFLVFTKRFYDPKKIRFAFKYKKKENEGIRF